jgi:hypothetical protein
MAAHQQNSGYRLLKNVAGGESRLNLLLTYCDYPSGNCFDLSEIAVL